MLNNDPISDDSFHPLLDDLLHCNQGGRTVCVRGWEDRGCVCEGCVKRG